MVIRLATGEAGKCSRAAGPAADLELSMARNNEGGAEKGNGCEERSPDFVVEWMVTCHGSGFFSAYKSPE